MKSLTVNGRDAPNREMLSRQLEEHTEGKLSSTSDTDKN